MQNTIQNFMTFKSEFASMFGGLGPKEQRDSCFMYTAHPILAEQALRVTRALGLDARQVDDRWEVIDRLRRIYAAVNLAVGSEVSGRQPLVEVLIAETGHE